jgi:hypothetical protein
MRAPLALLLAASALLTTASAARADSVDDATKIAARKIAEEGLELYDTGRYKEALERFARADALVHAPTMLLMAARSLDKLGRLVEASEKYAAASQMLLDARASDAFREAVKDAEKERAALLLRIPSVIMTVDAPPDEEIKLKLDGISISTASLGQKKLIDPGAHTLEASAGGVVATSRVDVKEGESRAVHLDLRTTAPPVSPIRTAGWVTIGLGAAGVIAGAVAGGLAVAKDEELKQCLGGACSTFKPDDLNNYNMLKGISSTGLIGGAVTLAGGVTLVLVAPNPSPASASMQVRLSPWIGLGSVGLRGAF